MKKIFLVLILTLSSIQAYAGSCPDGSDPVRSISADGTYFVFSCGSESNNALSAEINSYEDLDVASMPKKVLSDRDTKSLWDAYKTAPECFKHPTYGKGFGYQLTKISKNDFKNNAWTTPFFQLDENFKHEIQPSKRILKPIVTVKIDETYGEQNEEVEIARNFFKEAAYVVRFSNSNLEIEKVKKVLIDWAKNNALKEGINVSWGNKPVDWQMMMLINSILTTTASIGENLNAEERQIIGPWLNALLQKVAKSKWKDRQDNKAYLTSYMTLVWGLMVNDLNAVQNSIDVVKLAVHDMRPDGSLPIDTQRGGMGLKYNSDSFAYLLMMASVLKDVTGKDLFLYKANERGLINGANFVIKSIESPSKINQIYAISCPGGGDRWGSIKKPSTYHIDSSTYLLVYAFKYPNNKKSEFLIKTYEHTFNKLNTRSNIRYEPNSVFVLHPLLISSSPEFFQDLAEEATTINHAKPLESVKEVSEVSKAFDGSYSFTLDRFNPSEGSIDLGRGILEIKDGKISVAKKSRQLKTSSTSYYDTFEGQIDKQGNITSSFSVNALKGKGSPQPVNFSGRMNELKIKGKFDDYFEMIIQMKPIKSIEPVKKVGKAANTFDGSYALIIRTEPTDGQKNIGTAQFIIKDGKISIARKYRYLSTSAISSYDTFEGVIDKEGNIKASIELNPIMHMVEPKTIKFSGSMDSFQLRGKFDDIKFWDNNTKGYVLDENFYTSFFDVIIDFKKENY